MNASQPVLESENLPHAEESSRVQDGQRPAAPSLRQLPSHVMDQETQTDSFKKTATLFGRALSALFR
jgi:hypothetical protein